MAGSGPLPAIKGETITIISKHPVYLIDPTPSQIPYILYPGDSITITENKKGEIMLLTTNLIRNNELAFFSKLCQSGYILRPLFPTTYLGNVKSLTQRDSIIEVKYNDGLNFIKDYINRLVN